MSDPNQTGDVFGAASRASDYIEGGHGGRGASGPSRRPAG